MVDQPTTMPEAMVEIARSISDDTLVDLAKLNNENIDRQIYLADVKAQLILAAEALFIVTAASMSRGAYVNIFGRDVPLVNRLIFLVLLLMVGAMSLSLYYALLGSRPTMRLSKRGSLFFFGSIAKYSEDEYIREFTSQTACELGECILAQVHDKALIAQAKFTAITRSMNFLFVSLVLWVLIQLMFTLVK